MAPLEVAAGPPKPGAEAHWWHGALRPRTQRPPGCGQATLAPAQPLDDRRLGTALPRRPASYRRTESSDGLRNLVTGPSEEPESCCVSFLTEASVLQLFAPTGVARPLGRSVGLQLSQGLVGAQEQGSLAGWMDEP